MPAKQYIEPIWKKMGGTIVAMEPHQPGLTDYSAYLARIKAGSPDAIYDISTGQDQAYIVKGAREMGMKIPIVVPDWNPTDFNPIAGETSENAYVASDFFDRESTEAKTRKVTVVRGIGLEGKGAPRVRFLCPPEIVLLTLGQP